MALSDLIPWPRNRAVGTPFFSESGDPLAALHREVSRAFDEFARGFGVPARFGAAGTWPSVEVRETDKAIEVSAEMPGLEQKDVEVSLHEGVLTLKGEKKAESGNALYSERWHGSFERAISVGADIDPDKVSAAFRNGVLTVSLAKKPEAQKPARKIPVSAG